MEETNNVQTEQVKKFTYEELEDICHKLSEQSNMLYTKLQEANLTNLFKRLDYLFKVVENSSEFPMDFVDKCTKEIVAGLTIPEEAKKPTSETDSKKESK